MMALAASADAGPARSETPRRSGEAAQDQGGGADFRRQLDARGAGAEAAGDRQAPVDETAQRAASMPAVTAADEADAPAADEDVPPPEAWFGALLLPVPSETPKAPPPEAPGAARGTAALALRVDAGRQAAAPAPMPATIGTAVAEGLALPDAANAADRAEPAPSAAPTPTPVTAPRVELSTAAAAQGAPLVMDTEPTAEGLHERVVWMLDGGREEASLRLHPEELGSLEIRVRVDDNKQATIQFQADNAQARQLIESSLARLRELLAADGLQLAHSEVGGGSQEQAQARSSGRPGPVAGEIESDEAGLVTPLHRSHGRVGLIDAWS